MEQPILMLFTKQIRKLPLEQAIPFNKDDLMIVVSKNIAFRLTNLMDERHNGFYVQDVMEKETVFATPEFSVRMKKFAEIMEARMERFFDTGKAEYLFFDEEEQNYIRNVFNNHDLKCGVLIYVKKKKSGKFEELDFEQMDYKAFKKIAPHFKKLGIKCVVRPEKYFILKHQFNEKNRERFEKLKQNKEGAFMEKMFKRYKLLKEMNTKEDVAKYYKKLAVKYHPDKGGDPEVFMKIKSDFEAIKQSTWYAELGTPKFVRKAKGAASFLSNLFG